MEEYIGFYITREIWKYDKFSHREYHAGIGLVENKTHNTLGISGFEISSRHRPAETLEGLMKTSNRWSPSGRILYTDNKKTRIIGLTKIEYERLNTIRTSAPEPPIIIDSVKKR